MCRTDTWDFLAIADPIAVRKLVAAIINHWHARLSELAVRLRHKPPKRLWRRFATIPNHLRQVAAEREHLANMWAHIGLAVRNATLSPDRALSDLRTRTLRTAECPACRHVAAIGGRTGDLLVRSLGDSTTLARYQQSSGVCCRDLALAFSYCRDTEQARMLARAARPRLEVLEWELDEALRKEAWHVRHEPKGPEQSAWRRAMELVSGSHLDNPTLIGLTGQK